MISTSQAPAADEGKQDRKNNRVAIITGLIGLIAAIVTLATAIIGLQQSRISSLHQQVSTEQTAIASQRVKISRLQAQTVPDAPEGGSYLSNVNPISDGAGYGYQTQAGPVIIGGVRYPDSLTFQCAGPGDNGSAALVYPASGREFTAIIGYGDAAGNGDANVSAVVTITDQAGRILGDRVEVTPGHPLRVQLPLNGVSQLGFACAAVNTQTGLTPDSFPEISLANAAT